MDTNEPETLPCAICFCLCDDGYVQSYRGDKLVRTTCTGCDRDERYAEFARDGRLNTWLVDDANMVVWIADVGTAGRWRTSTPQRVAAARRVCADVKPLRRLIGRVDREVWFGGMQAFARASGYKGTRLAASIVTPCGEAKVLCFTMCGRAMITIDAATCSVTLITDEASEEPRMGLRGIDATAAEAVHLLGALLRAWSSGKGAMVDDGTVGLALPWSAPSA